MTASSAALADVAPDFVEMAHRIVWCTAATTDAGGRPRTRVLHPIWEFDGEQLTGWIATAPQSLKARHLEHTPFMSLTYWTPDQDTCSAECETTWDTADADRRAGWQRFAEGPEPVGYDPTMIDGWESWESPGFGVLRLRPTRLRVMPGSVLLERTGEVLDWSVP